MEMGSEFHIHATTIRRYFIWHFWKVSCVLFLYLLFFSLKFCLNLEWLDKWCLGGEDGNKLFYYFLAWCSKDQRNRDVAMRPLARCTLFYCFPYLKSLIGDKVSCLGVRCNDCRSELARQIRVNWARESAPSTGSIDGPQSPLNRDGGKVVFPTAILVYSYV